MEKFLLDAGMSWTFSKALPYVLFILIGLALVLLVRKRSTKKVWRGISWLLLPIPFLIYFAFVPIYEGDFSNAYRTEAAIDNELPNKTLVAIAMAGCPFCYASIDDLKAIKQRTSSTKIKFMVFTKDAEQVKWYSNKAKKAFEVIQMDPTSKTMQYARGHFPTFVYRDGKTVYIWSNSSFGVRAKDWLEKRI